MNHFLIHFTLTSDHIKLLQHFMVGWQDCEYGAPEIDPKRPYGNSDVEMDIAKILGWKLKKIDDEETLSDVQLKTARQLHTETETALQIILYTKKFEVGYYECDRYERNWKKVKKAK